MVGEAGDEGCMLGRGQALFQRRDQGLAVVAEQGARVEPETGEALRTVQSIGVGRHPHQAAVAAHMPEHLVGVERAKAVARGDLTPREVAPTDDEIGELAVAFERMVEAVARASEVFKKYAQRLSTGRAG